MVLTIASIRKMRSTDVNVLRYDEFINVVLSAVKLLGTIIGNLDVITLGLDFETEMVSYMDTLNVPPIGCLWSIDWRLTGIY